MLEERRLIGVESAALAVLFVGSTTVVLAADAQATARITLPKSIYAASALSGGSRTPDASAFKPDPKSPEESMLGSSRRPLFEPPERQWTPEGALLGASRAPAYRVGGDGSLDTVVGPSRTPDASAYRPDPAFDAFVSPAAIGKAWDSLDGAALTDAALAMLEAERVLLRPHRSLPAREVVAVAAQLAAHQGDEAALDRLEKAAKQHSRPELGQIVATSRKSASTSHPAAVPVDVATVSPDQYRLCAAVSRAAVRANVTGDPRYILPIVIGDGEVVLPSTVPGAADAALKQRVVALCGALPDTPGVAAGALDILAARSRFDDVIEKRERPSGSESEPDKEAKDPKMVTGAY